MKALTLASLIFSLAASSARAASYTEALLALHKSLVEVDSTSNAEAPGTEVLKTYLENNFTVELQTVTAGRQNVYAYSGSSREARVLLTSHYDTVPPYIPYSRNGDEIRGRGTSDAKGSIAAQVIAVEDLLASGEISEGDVSLLFVVGEEVGGDGMKAANNLNLTWEAVVFGEPTENQLVRAHKGVLGLNVTATGIAGHSGYPEQGRNAIDLLVRSLGGVIGAELPSSEEFGNTTLNVGVIEGGIASNVIPENATARASIRVAVDDIDSIKDVISKAAYAATPEHVSLSFNTGGKPVSLDYDVEGFNTTIANYYTDVPYLEGDHKKYLYGPGTILVAHSNDERITVSDLEGAVEGYKKLILESLKPPPTVLTTFPSLPTAAMSPIPDVVFEKIDKYVDSLAPQIQPRITSELEIFQNKTIDSLEDQVIDAFRSLFNKDKDPSGARSLNDSPPDSYGGQSLPFADEIAKLTQSFSKITDGAGDDLREIFDLTEGRGGGGGQTQSRGIDHTDSFSRGAKGFLSAAINAVQDHIGDDRQGGGNKFELDGLLGVLSNTVKDAARNPEEKARLISPEIKEKVGAKLRDQHAPIAEQFTRIALDHIKRWLRGNTSTRDLGDGMKGEVEDQVKDLVKGIGGLFGKKHSSGEGASRGLGDRDGEEGGSGSGFSRVISDKLSTGLAKVHREVRLEFRNILGGIEKQLFELLPDQFQRPLEKILGGNPFDSQLDREAGGSTDRGFGDDIKVKLVSKIRGLIRKVQETLRESILGVVNGGHRKFERESWVFVQNMVETKVQKYLPNVKINVPDDIGNEGVSVGSPNVQLGGGNQPVPPAQGNYPPPPSHHDSGGQQQGYNPGNYQQQQHQEYRPDQYQQQQHQEYRPDQYQQHQGYQSEQHHSGQQNYGGQNQGHGGTQSYGGNQGYYGGNQGYDQNQGHGQNPDYGQNPRY
ncbi:hypothetical protein K4K58_007304 [Colletotrichum sp. SAR11_239]|nr:hypothetical protein K4K58_007304 [Colletotrichum sp. SAR11_239]